MENFYGQKEAGQGNYFSRADCYRQNHLPLRGHGLGRMSPADYSTSARSFETDWLKIPLLGETETVISLGLVTWA